MTDLPSDYQERLRVLDPGRSFIVEAPAGSGKTALLTQRFLKLLAGVDEPEQIIALTFTRKAAQEMRGRVLESLRAATGPAPAGPFESALHGLGRAALERDEARGWQLLDNPARLRIQTIDALASMIARQIPLRSGFGPGIELLEDADDLYREAASLAIEELDARRGWSESVLVLLRHLDNDWLRFETLLADMLARRDQWLRLIARGRDRRHLETQLTHTVTRALASLAESITPAITAELLRLCRFAATNLTRSAPDSSIAQLNSIETLPGADPADLERWIAIADLLLTQSGQTRKRVTKNEGFLPGDKQTREMKALFTDVVARLSATPGLIPQLHAVRELPPCRYTDRQWATIEALLDMLVVAAAHLRLLFDARARVDFIEVAHAALLALGKPEAPTDLNLALDHRISHLLVDEFQDTSVTQYELLETLLAGWTGDDGRSVFFVGDPMQSIYRFRQAEVHLFTGTAQRGYISSVPLERIRLSANFRTQAAAVEWLNERFPIVMNTAQSRPQVFSPVTPERPARPGPPVSIHVLEEDSGVTEADRVTAIIGAARARDPAGTIAILVRSRAHLAGLPAALAAAGIPVSASEIDPLASQPIVSDLIALTRALLHRADRTAWLGVLRAPWCGLRLDALAALTGDDPNATVWQRINNPEHNTLLSVDDRKRLARSRVVLAKALCLSGRIRLSDLVESTWVELDGPRCAERADELNQARHYFDLLVKLDNDAAELSPQRLHQHVDQLYATPPSRGPGPVEIMTIHRAKGLEFDTVILPGLARTTRGEPHRLLMWREQLGVEANPELLMAPIAETGSNGDPIYSYLRAREREALDAELFRLLYVALTRAKESLHLVGQVKRRENDLPVPDRRTFLGMLWPALVPDLEPCPQMDSAEPAGPAVTVPSAGYSGLRRLPADGLPRSVSRSGLTAPHYTPGAGMEFDWASSSAKHIGTVTHWMLQRIGEEGISAWSVDRVAGAADQIAARLTGLGVPGAEIDAARRRVAAALTTFLNSERGLWIMADEHRDTQSEYHLTGYDESRFINVILDRTFIDARGLRWIIDFKTGTHTGGSLDAFLRSEVERYRGQLETYAGLMNRMEQRPIALGLYFPLLDEWRDWRYRQ